MKFSSPTILSLFLLAASTVTAQPGNNDADNLESIACATADIDADCNTCLNEGCVLAKGEGCLSSCDFIADITCFDMQYYEGQTVDEVCFEVAEMEADQEICGAKAIQEDCELCTSTLKSDGESTCEYYSGMGGDYCGMGGCDMNGVCGETTCDAPEDGDEPGGEGGPGGANGPGGAGGPGGNNDLGEGLVSTECPGMGRNPDCNECLSAGCGFVFGDCMMDCSVIMDAPCWSMDHYQDRNMTVTEVCTNYEMAIADNQICGGGRTQDCEVCTSTMKSDEISMCQWYVMPDMDNGGYCGTGGCDMMGICGSDTCDAPIVEGNGTTVFGEVDIGGGPCGGFSDCEPCLNSKIECAWIADQCVRSCDMIADAACYHPSTFPNMTGPEICAIAADATEEIFDDSVTPCNGFDSCEPCLNSRMECAWIGGGCELNCDVIADATCYHPALFLDMNGPEICAKAVEAGDAVAPMDAEEGPMDMEEDFGAMPNGEEDTSEEATDADAELDEGAAVVERDFPTSLESGASSLVRTVTSFAAAVAVFALL